MKRPAFGTSLANTAIGKIYVSRGIEMKIDLHVHTSHSFDCKSRVEDVVRSAEEAGLDAIAITDHDTRSAVELASGLARHVTIIPGTEISSWKGIHIIGLFIHNEIVSRDIFEIIDEIHLQGGLAVIPHPFRHSTGLLYGKEKHHLFSGEDLKEIMSRIDLVEVINYGCKSEENIEANTYFEAFPDLPQIAGSDAHEPSAIGRAYVEIPDAKTDNLDRIKRALLKSSRVIRYEAFDIDGDSRKEKYLAGQGKNIFSNLKGSLIKIMARINRRSESGDGP